MLHPTNNKCLLTILRIIILDVAERDLFQKNIEKLFKSMGFKIIKPEKLKFNEQLRILQNCKCFAATEGSISHNAIFLKEGTKTILLRKCWGINEYQLVVNSARNLDVIYVDAHLSVPKINKFGGPFFMYINNNLILLVKHLANRAILFGGFYYSDFMKYFRKLTMNTNYNDLLIDNYYYEILKTEMRYTQLRYKVPRFLNNILSIIFFFLTPKFKNSILNKLFKHLNF